MSVRALFERLASAPAGMLARSALRMGPTTTGPAGCAGCTDEAVTPCGGPSETWSILVMTATPAVRRVGRCDTEGRKNRAIGDHDPFGEYRHVHG